jgi:hypothetical protein
MSQQEWVRTHTIGGRVVGEFAGDQPDRRLMAVIMTLHGPEIAPRDTLLPLDAQDVIDSLAHRFEDLINAAQRVGYSPEDIQAAAALALQRHQPVVEGLDDT